MVEALGPTRAQFRTHKSTDFRRSATTSGRINTRAVPAVPQTHLSNTCFRNHQEPYKKTHNLPMQLQLDLVQLRWASLSIFISSIHSLLMTHVNAIWRICIAAKKQWTSRSSIESWRTLAVREGSGLDAHQMDRNGWGRGWGTTKKGKQTAGEQQAVTPL